MPVRPARRRILEAAKSLYAAGDRPSTKQIAAAAGVSRATFYRQVGSHAALLAELEVEPDPAARERILEVAGELLADRGLPGLSMDELAERAGVSRATLYRLFPGKPALFKEVVKEFSPLEPVVAVVERLRGSPPEEVMPAIARAAYAVISRRSGLLLSLLPQVASLEPDAEEAVRHVVQRFMGSVVTYVVGQMVAGRLRPMHPVLAIQSFVGPIAVHALTRRLFETQLGFDVDPDVAVTELALNWVRGMGPEA